MKRIIIIAVIIIAAVLAFIFVPNATGLTNSKNPINIAKDLIRLVKKEKPANTLANEKETSDEDAQEETDSQYVIGCLSYMDFYIYFNEEGVVVYTSSEKEDGLLLVTGVSIDHFAVGSQIEVEKENIFSWILETYQTLGKYDIYPDKIVFTDQDEMIIHLKKVKVEVGKNEYVIEKLTELANFTDELSNLSGTLDMRDFDGSNKSFTFTANVKEKKQKQSK